MSTQVITIILIVVGVIAGYVFGLIDSRFTSSLRKKNEPEKPAADPTPPEANLPGEHTVLKVTIDAGLKWHLELDGARLEHPEEISQEQRQRAVSVVVQMRPWLDGKTVPVAAEAAAPLPAPVMPKPKTEPTQPPAPAVAAAASKDNLKISPLRGLTSMVTKDVKAAVEKKPTSIVSMINDVLQARLPSTPFREIDIQLEEGAMGEVMVLVGHQTYNGIDAVPDPEIRNLIRSAIAEWEKK